MSSEPERLWMACAGLLTGCLTRACGDSERQCAHGTENTDSRHACARRLFSRAWRSLSGTPGAGLLQFGGAARILLVAVGDFWSQGANFTEWPPLGFQR